MVEGGISRTLTADRFGEEQPTAASKGRNNQIFMASGVGIFIFIHEYRALIHARGFGTAPRRRCVFATREAKMHHCPSLFGED
jgi:hypothetical protein